MTNRQTIKCSICDYIFSLRVGVGNGKQIHHFNCPKCTSPLRYSYHIRNFQKNDIWEEFQNCTAEPISTSADVLNLHAEIPIPKKHINDPKFSANIHLMMMAARAVGPDNMSGIADSDAIIELWDQLKINWDLYSNNKFDLLKGRIKDSDKYSSIKEGFFNQLYSFASVFRLKQLASPSLEALGSLVNGLDANSKPEFERFLKFHNEELLSKNLAFYKTALNDIFFAFHDMRQVRLICKLGVSTSDYFITSIDFDSSKKLYGNLFEILDKTFNTVPLLIRIKTEGAYDKFQSKDLDSYLSTSLLNKLDYIPSKDIFDLPNDLATNNKIRNSSHHNTIAFDHSRQIVICRDKDKTFEISYLDYLMGCTYQANYLVGQILTDLALWKSYQKLATPNG